MGLSLKDCRIDIGMGRGSILQRSLDVRHAVYVEEKRFEKDSYTSHDLGSLHVVFSVQEEGRWKDAGCARLILAGGRVDGIYPWQDVYRKEGRLIYSLPPMTGEISRLAVLAKYRKYPSVVSALVLTCFKAAHDSGRDAVYYMAAPRLNDYVNRQIGIPSDVCAPEINKNGFRTTYRASTDLTKYALTPNARQILDWIEPQWDQPSLAELMSPHKKRLLAASFS